MNQRGYLLMEMLVASVLFTVAGSGLYMGYLQGVKADRTVRESSKIHDPVRMGWIKLEKDLRNTVVLRDYRFNGKPDEMSFPISVTETDQNGLRHTRLFQIDYRFESGTLVRSELELSGSGSKEVHKKEILKNVDSVSFSYPYLDEKEKIVYESSWPEAPYFGIPRAVRIQIQSGDASGFSKLAAIPQGRWGRLADKERTEIKHEF